MATLDEANLCANQNNAPVDQNESFASNFTDSEDEFDDFNEFQEIPKTEPISHCNEQSENYNSTNDVIRFDSFDNDDFAPKFEALTNKLFPQHDSKASSIEGEEMQLLNERSSNIYAQLSLTPHLKPPNWTKSKIRRHLLIQLGVPVNLDEILPASSVNEELLLKPQTRTKRQSSASEININWQEFQLPKFEDLKLTSEQESQERDLTADTLSRIEKTILEHSSPQFMKNESDEDINLKYLELKENYSDLLNLASIWQNHLSELKKEYEIYESVVQNMVGHTQRLKRDELIANLNKVKVKDKKKRWK